MSGKSYFDKLVSIRDLSTVPTRIAAHERMIAQLRGDKAVTASPARKASAPATVKVGNSIEDIVRAEIVRIMGATPATLTSAPATPAPATPAPATPARSAREEQAYAIVVATGFRGFKANIIRAAVTGNLDTYAGKLSASSHKHATVAALKAAGF
jgi:hypothetical protein